MEQLAAQSKMNSHAVTSKIFILLALGFTTTVEGFNVLSHWALNGSEPGLTLHGGPTFVEGRYPGSKAINFNKPSNCFARIPKVELRGRSFTIAAWIKVKSILDRGQSFISDWYDPWQFDLFIYKDGTFRYRRFLNSTQSTFNLRTTKVIKTGKWTHVAVTWDQGAGVVKLFINAKEEGFKVFSTETVWNPPTKDTYEIGDNGRSDNKQFFGSVMDLYIIEGVLNSEQLKYLRGFGVLIHWALNGSEPGLTLHGGPTFIEGRYPGSKAINFNQPSNCFAQFPKVELRGRSFTIAAWIKVKSILDRTQSLISDWYNPWQFFLGIWNTGHLAFKRHSSAQPWFYVTATKAIEVDKWTHVAVTWDQDAGIVKLFIDSKEDTSKVFSTKTVWKSPTKDTYQIGDDGHYDNRQFLGSVMDLYIIEGVLNSEQLKYLRGFPQITSSINNTVVYTNETVQCHAVGSPTPYVAWARSGAVLVNQTSTAEITITENNGEYVCVATNREGENYIHLRAKAPLEICHNYTIISDVSRAVSHIFQPSDSKKDSTDIDLSKWYRIESPAGNQLPTTCVPQNRCGTQAPGWLSGAHPSVQDGIVKRTICFHFNGDCCYHNTTVHIRKCIGFYVYKFSGVAVDKFGRYCVEHGQYNSDDHPDSIFKETQHGPGYSLVGHVVYTQEETLTHYACMDYCLLWNGCKSFNYSKILRICELNNATRGERPEAFTKKHTFVYYEKITVQAIDAT